MNDSTKVSDMTVDELRELIAEIIDEKLSESLGDRDEGLTMREEIKLRLMASRNALRAGEPTVSLEDVAAQLEDNLP